MCVAWGKAVVSWRCSSPALSCRKPAARTTVSTAWSSWAARSGCSPLGSRAGTHGRSRSGTRSVAGTPFQGTTAKGGPKMPRLGGWESPAHGKPHWGALLCIPGWEPGHLQPPAPRWKAVGLSQCNANPVTSPSLYG